MEFLYVIPIWLSPAVALLIWARFGNDQIAGKLMARLAWSYVSFFLLLVILEHVLRRACSGDALKGFTSCVGLPDAVANYWLPVFGLGVAFFAISGVAVAGFALWRMARSNA